MEEARTLIAMNLLAYAVQRDVSPATLCEKAGVALTQLQNGKKGVLDDQQFHRLWTSAAALTGDACFGLHFGESLQVAALGVVGQIIQTSATVGDALTQAAGMTHLITDQFGLEVTHNNTSFTVRFIPHTTHVAARDPAFRQIMDFYMVFALHELDGLTLKKIRPLHVSYPHLPAAHQQEYNRLLRCDSIRQDNQYTIVMEKSCWSVPIITANYELQAVLLKKVSDMMDAGNGDLKTRIRNFLLANAYLGIPTLEAIAANLNTSARSLQRKLKEEGSSYQEIVDAVRRSLTLHYLQSGDYPLKEISYMLGYNERSAFNRAFKRWTGATPLDYKKNQQYNSVVN
ncbi:AraC family transcriptional regulator [Chitinophaga pendula]|uniref:AraC family transcriptional regulator n=1 Tax=Chitinophaga TaxID=79328 RepID=UPI000BAE8722|nr:MULTISPECIES: AraC family transcriptional regulator [Chitinophaga]ASZ15123.1 AraC family transcriptional regulator [Chitinophaga sp. MD30]UCJ08147.1 AraC family transcriptional regulator [Chitinophaga pendula]